MRFARYFPLLFICAIAIVGIYVLFSQSYEAPPVVQTHQAQPTPKAYESVEHLGETYAYFWMRVSENMMLIPNFTERSSAKEIALENTCTRYINGGFYIRDDESIPAIPIGLFVTEGIEISPTQTNHLFDGFVSLDDGSITEEAPTVSKNAFQTGPLLILEGHAQTRVFTSDKFARRMIAFTTYDDAFYFATFFSPSSYFSGPRLADLPELVSELGHKLNLDISAAINLDGGSASVFSNGDTTLTELSPVGSLVCIR